MIVYVKSKIHIKIHIKIYINYLMFSPAFTSQSSSGVSHRSFGLEEIATGKWQSTAILKDQTSPHTWKKDSNMLNRWPLWMVCTWWKLAQASCISHCSDIESTEWLGYTIRDRTAKKAILHNTAELVKSNRCLYRVLSRPGSTARKTTEAAVRRIVASIAQMAKRDPFCRPPYLEWIRSLRKTQVSLLAAHSIFAGHVNTGQNPGKFDFNAAALVPSWQVEKV